MAVSKRLRFEVLRRDNHTCRYCGASAPDAKIAVDHVVPKSLGGLDVAENLVAACVDCNTGKSSSQPDAEFVRQVEEDAFQWKTTLKDALRKQTKETVPVISSLEVFEEIWRGYTFTSTGEQVPLESGWRDSYKTWLSVLTEGQLDDAEWVGLASKAIDDLVPGVMKRDGINNRYRYFCGCVWNMIRKIQAGQEKPVKPEPKHEPASMSEPIPGHVVSELEGGWFICSCGVPGCAAVRAEIVARAHEPYDSEASDRWVDYLESDHGDHSIYDDDGIIRCECGDPYCSQVYVHRLLRGSV